MFDEDLDSFFSPADFAVEARVSGEFTIPVIFDAAYLRALDIVSTTNPVALARASDDQAAVGETIVINEVWYTIRDRQPHDDGAVVLLQLEAQ